MSEQLNYIKTRLTRRTVKSVLSALTTTTGSSGGGGTWGSITGTLSNQTDLQTALDAKLSGFTVVSSNTTAANDTFYSVVASATFTDPTPVEGKGYIVLVRNGTATIGGTGYSIAGTLVKRFFHSGAWATYNDGGLTGSGTPNEIAYFTGASSLASLPTATYPNLTELSYVKGVTSPIQTQINNINPVGSKLYLFNAY